MNDRMATVTRSSVDIAIPVYNEERDLPVEWVEDPDSRVDISSTVLTDLRGVVRLLRGPSPLEPWTRPPAVQQRESL